MLVVHLAIFMFKVHEVRYMNTTLSLLSVNTAQLYTADENHVLSTVHSPISNECVFYNFKQNQHFLNEPSQ